MVLRSFQCNGILMMNIYFFKFTLCFPYYISLGIRFNKKYFNALCKSKTNSDCKILNLHVILVCIKLNILFPTFSTNKKISSPPSAFPVFKLDRHIFSSPVNALSAIKNYRSFCDQFYTYFNKSFFV